MVNYNDLTGWDLSLSYCDYKVGENTVLGLMKRFFKDRLAQSTNTKICTLFAFIKVSQIGLITLRNKMLLNGIYFKVLKIEGYNPLQENTATKITASPEAIPSKYFSTFGCPFNNP